MLRSELCSAANFLSALLPRALQSNLVPIAVASRETTSEGLAFRVALARAVQADLWGPARGYPRHGRSLVARPLAGSRCIPC